MRLTPDEITAIRDCASAVFGPGAVVRLFGSRVHDHLSGGDIDLHITADSDEPVTFHHEGRFKDALERRIGEQRIDVLVNGPGGPKRAIEKIAIETGLVLPSDNKPSTAVVGRNREIRRTRAVDELIADALRAGEHTRERLLRVLDELGPALPLTNTTVVALDWFDQLRTDSLLLQFNNMVAIVQDQLVRSILIKSEEAQGRQSRIDQRNTAEKIGALPSGIDFREIADVRNEIAHQYPADEKSQARLINAVAMLTLEIVRAFDGLAAYARRTRTDSTLR